MINHAIIIEDEKPAARLLQRKLQKLGISADVMLHSVEESVEWLGSNPQPDLIFLDIQLSDGLSFEIFEKVPVKSSIIFTTAYDEYALRAFKVNSIDYLLKPIDEDELEAAVLKFHELQNTHQAIDFSQIRHILNLGKREYKERFTVKIGHQLRVIDIADVECFYSENKGTYLHTFDNRDYVIDTALEALEPDLDPKKFFRVSRKFILPLTAIKELQAYSNSRLKVMLPTFKNDEVIVAREKVADFKKWLE